MPLAAVSAGQQISHNDIDQLINLLTGVMNDQPVTLKGDYATVGPNLRLSSLSAGIKGGSLRFDDAGTGKWEINKNADLSLNVVDLVRGAPVLTFASNGDISLPSVAKLLGSADFRTAARLIAGPDPGGGSNGDVIANRGGASPGTGVYYFGSSGGSHYLYYDGTQYNLTDRIAVTGYVATDTGIKLSGAGDPGAPGIHRFDPYIYVEGNGSILLRPNFGSGVGQTLIDTNGLHTMTNTLIVPPSAGGTPAASSYGTVPVKFAETLLGAISADVIFSSIPSGFRHCLPSWFARTDLAGLNNDAHNMRFNNDATANYDNQTVRFNNTTTTPAEALGATAINLGRLTAATATANYFGQGSGQIRHYAGTTGNKFLTLQAACGFDNLTSSQENTLNTSKWRTVGTAINRIDFIPSSSASYIVGSFFSIGLEP